MNTCLPMNNKTLAPMLDVAIVFEDNKYKVFGLTESFQAVSLGEFDNVFDAYAVKLSYGFKETVYEVTIDSFRSRRVSFNFDQIGGIYENYGFI